MMVSQLSQTKCENVMRSLNVLDVYCFLEYIYCNYYLFDIILPHLSLLLIAPLDRNKRNIDSSICLEHIL